MRLSLPSHTTLALLGIFLLTTIVSSLIASTYLRIQYTDLFAKNLSSLHTGITTYSTYIRIHSVDTSLRAILAETRSVHADQTIVTLAVLSPDFYVERRDAVLKEGVIVGTTPVRRASLEELTPGMQGFGKFSVTKDGAIQLRYLMIGDPFPRP